MDDTSSFMTRRFFRSVQSYALAYNARETPTTQDFSFHESESGLVRSLLLLPSSQFFSPSYSSLKSVSGCKINVLGCCLIQDSSRICSDGISRNSCPFNFPAMASPFTCLHQLLVLLSSNIALKWTIPTSRKVSAWPLTV